jgi:phage terminase Nu1 subunit (DNA packaging protein)
MATVLGIDPRTVRDLGAQGILPRDGRTGKYRLVACVKAYVDHRLGKAVRADDEALDYNAERARLTKHQADRARLRYDTESGRLVEADAAQLALEHVLVPVRQYFREQGSRIAPELVGLAAHDIRAAIDRDNARELGRLANPILEFTGPAADPEVDALADDPDDGNAAATAGVDSGAGDAGASED